jgi:hypothetical protein
MEDAAAELAYLNAALDSEEQAGAASLPDGILESRLDKRLLRKRKKLLQKRKQSRRKNCFKRSWMKPTQCWSWQREM